MTDLILPLEKQVCTLESSKILKDLGVPQRSLFYWCNTLDANNKFFLKDYANIVSYHHPLKYSAFTVGELGIFLPALWLNKINKQDELGLWPNIVASQEKDFWKYEVEARSLMLRYLLENKLIEVPK